MKTRHLKILWMQLILYNVLLLALLGIHTYQNYHLTLYYLSFNRMILMTFPNLRQFIHLPSLKIHLVSRLLLLLFVKQSILTRVGRVSRRPKPTNQVEFWGSKLNPFNLTNILLNVFNLFYLATTDCRTGRFLSSVC